MQYLEPLPVYGVEEVSLVMMDLVNEWNLLDVIDGW